MAEYIEREKLLFHLASEIENCGEADSSHRPIAYGSMIGLKTALSCVNTLPSADVVEVVRCKDCKHYDFRNAKCLLHSEYADQYSSGFNFEMYSKDFCSYGELKEREKV